MTTVQDEIFREGEADRWYARNRINLDSQGTFGQQLSHDVKLLIGLLEPFSDSIHRVLEIGCCSGNKLQTLCQALSASGEGIEPSRLAVADGNERMKGTPARLVCGTAEKLPFEASSFDLVYFGFCLYLLDRSTLLQALAEADRVLRKGGFLAMTDFDPGVMHKRPYTHREGVFSYKQDYSRFYTEGRLYYLVSKSTFSHQQAYFDPVTDERVSLSLLYKEPDPYPLRDSDSSRPANA